MGYKIVYLEDLEPDSIKREIESQGFEVIHVQPKGNFEETLKEIQQCHANLLLMDFRLNAGEAKFNAPPFAQFFRSQVVETNVSLPIVLISSEDNISVYYRDFTSFDLFDFAIDKTNFLRKINKYCSLFNELIEGYEELRTIQTSQEKIDIKLLKVPEALQMRIDNRFLDTLLMDKYQSNQFMMSGLLLSFFVKPIGILIGPDLLSARLGVSKTSKDWNNLLNFLAEFKYSGLYSKTYDRWWSQGIEIWWKSNFSSTSTLRRLSATDRCKLISEKYGLSELVPLEKSEYSVSDRLWTICAGNHQPLDPIDGFEIAKDINNSPWLEPRYYSLNFLVNHSTSDILGKLKEQERERLSEKRKSS